MNTAVINHGGELGWNAGNAEVLGEQFANAVDRYEQRKRETPDAITVHLSFAYGELTAIAAMAIGALERAEFASKDPLDALRREDEERAA